MIEALKNWLQTKLSDGSATKPIPVRATLPHTRVSRRVELAASGGNTPIKFDRSVHGEIETVGPGKNVLMPNRYAVEETGTHEMLAIVDDAEAGIDPYNTGEFDRARKWDTRFRK